jgi:hypothetical protein
MRSASARNIGYGVGPRLCSPELEKLIITSLSTFETRVDSTVKQQGRVIEHIKQSLSEVKLGHEALQSCFSVAKEQTLEEINRIGRAAIDDAKEKAIEAATFFMENSSQSLKRHFEEEFQQQIREGIVSKIKDLVNRLTIRIVRFQVVQELTGDLLELRVSLYDELTSKCSDFVNEKFNEKWREELSKWESMIAETTKKEVAAQVKTFVDAQRNESNKLISDALKQFTSLSYSKRDVDTIFEALKIEQEEARKKVSVEVISHMKPTIDHIRSDIAELAKEIKHEITRSENNIEALDKSMRELVLETATKLSESLMNEKMVRKNDMLKFKEQIDALLKSHDSKILDLTQLLATSTESLRLEFHSEMEAERTKSTKTSADMTNRIS